MRFGILALALVVLATPVAAPAQRAGKVSTLGILSPLPSPPPEQRGRGVVADKLKELGWIEGQNLIIERAYGEGREDRLPELAEMLVRRRVDVIWAVGPPSAVAAARATNAIPIVFWGVGFPVELGLVDDLARPGRNVTGMAFSPGPEIIGKQLEFLKQIAPAVTRLAWITYPDSKRTVYRPLEAVLDSAVRQLGLELRKYPAERREDFDAIFAAATAWRAQAIGLIGSPLLGRERTRIVEFANRNRLASTFGMRDFVEVGGLMSYAPDTRETVLQSFVYVDKILRGARPADLPVEQPNKYDLVINLKTAKALGLTIPPSLLLRADHVIE
jgi:putative ABC transport system substrate-binding protein